MLEQSADLLQSLRPARRRKVARRPGLSALFEDDLFAGATPGTAATDKPVMIRELLKRTTPNDITHDRLPITMGNYAVPRFVPVIFVVSAMPVSRLLYP